MDAQTATQLAAGQLVDQLGKPAGFMIALRIIQVIAERSSPVTPELVEAFAACLKSMEHFATTARLNDEASAQASPADGGADGASAASAHDGAGEFVGENSVGRTGAVTNGHNDYDGNGSHLA